MAMNENRFVDLEIKLAYQEDLLQTLNNIVANQQKQIGLLENAYRLLNDRINQLHHEKRQDIVDEPPPHY